MKKFLIISTVIVALLLIVLILIPIFYKDKISELVKREANKNLNARLEFEDIGLSLLSNFPNFTLSIKKPAIINNPPFAGDTLVALTNFETTVDLRSLVRGNTVKIVSIALREPRANLQVLKDGRVNWDITKPTEEPAPTDTTPMKAFHLALQRYEIKNGHISYHDESAKMSILAQGLEHTGSGDFSQEHFKLRTQTQIAALTLRAGGVSYLNQVRTRLKADLDVDAAAKKFTMLENELQLNDLFLRFDGSATTASDFTDLDLTFSAPKTDFKNIISLIPAIYAKDFADLKSGGQIGLQGEVKGRYSETDFPTFNLSLVVNNGMFQYPKLPTVVNNVNVNLYVNNPGGNADNTVIDLKKFHVEWGSEPFDANLRVKTPVSDPHLAATAKGKINLGEIENILPLSPGTELAGLLTADLHFAGNLLSLQKGEYQKFQAAGNILAKDVAYRSAKLPEKIVVKQARLVLAPENFKLSDLECALGQSDLQANGTLDNVLSYLLKEAPLKGTLMLTSRFFDLNPWLEGESQQLTAVELPDKVEFTMNSSFQEVRFDNLRLQNVNGLLVLKDRTLHLMDLKMNLLGGSLLANGGYATPKGKPPHSFFEFNITNFDIGQTFESFLTVQKFAPIAKSLQGNFGASFTMTTDLDQSLTPIWQTLSSRGSLHIGKAVITDFKPLTVMSDLLKLEKLKRLGIENVHPSYKIREGRFQLEPLSFTADNLNFVVSGSNGIDQSLDYSVKIRVPSKELNRQANALISQLTNKNIDLLQGEAIDLVGSIRGSLTDPVIKFSTAELVKGVVAQATSVVKKQIQTQQAAVTDSVSAEIEKRKQELEKAKQAAADSIRRESERLKEEAKKRLQKLFKP